MSDKVSRSWFAVFNNPEKHGYSGTPEEIIERLKNEWIADKPLRKGHWAYCISASGTPHVHMVLENSSAMRFSAVKKAYPKANLAPTKADRKTVLAYINKEPPYDSKGETIICSASHGNIEGHKRFVLSNQNETLYAIERLIEDGLTPNQIMDEDIKFRKEETLIRKAYFAKRYKETPPQRNIRVVWHLGASGSGKSYSYVKLCEQYGDENVYLFSDYANKGANGFDCYSGERIVVIDELKKGSLPFEFLLTITQGYRTQIHCRYANVYSLWDAIEVNSIYPPEDIYDSIVSISERDKDPIKQLLRRITKYVYHYKLDNEYRTFELDGKLYTNYSELKKLVTEAIKEEKVDEHIKNS